MQEDKEKQIQGLLVNKIKQCLNFDLFSQQADGDQIMSEGRRRPLELVINLNVISTCNGDGNLYCALFSVANDLLLQTWSVEDFGPRIVQNLLWATVVIKTKTKVMIDPKSAHETSLSNNLVLVTAFLPLSQDAFDLFQGPTQIVQQQTQFMQDKIGLAVDKGANFLRTSSQGALPSSIVQLEYQPSVLSLKELKDISDYVKQTLAAKFFSQCLQQQNGTHEYLIRF